MQQKSRDSPKIIKQTIKKIMTNNERTMLIHDKSMWQANKELEAEGQVTDTTYTDYYTVV